jgi:hypothetical protein
MKIIIGLGFALLLLQSCNNSSQKEVATAPVQTKDDPNFFPVTDYIKGQIKEINDRQINPKKYISINNHTDSSWLKMEELPIAFDDFLHPEIDSVNLIPWFKESKFLDQSIDAFTFTYDPLVSLPDSMALQHWDVYIEPSTGKVRRIYMVKKTGEGKTRQLTWQGGKWCKIVDIITKPDGESVVEKEVKITWEL